MTPSITVNSKTVQITPISLAAHGSAVIPISKDLKVHAPWQKNGFGPILLVHDGPPAALNSGGWVEDDDTGYSNRITFGSQTGTSTTLFGTQILIGRAGDAFNLPGSFVVSSTLVMLNMSGQAIDVEGELVFSDTQIVAKAPITALHLEAGEVSSIDLNRIKAMAGVPSSLVSASIKLNYSGPNGALLARAFGITDDSFYGFYWALQSTPGGWSYSESYWTIEGQSIPLLTVTNFADKPDRIAVILTSNSGVYSMDPLDLQPGESRTVNVRDFIARTRPFPPEVNFGGFSIKGSSPESRVLVKEHVIDPQSRLSAPFYGLPVYCTHYDFDSASYTVGAGSQISVNSIAYYSDGSYGPAGNSFSSGNTSIVTITGFSGFGTVTGVATGTTTVSNEIRTQSDVEGDVDTFSAEAQTTVLPVVNLNVSQTNFTISRQNGTAQFSVDAQAGGGFSNTITGSISISGPSNPGQVTLTQGGSGTSFNFSLQANQSTSGSCNQPTTNCFIVKTEK